MNKIAAILVLVFGVQSNALAQEHKGHDHDKEKDAVEHSQDHKGHDHKKEEGKITTPELLTQELEGDVVYGDQSAPITIVEYASLSCGHCAKFYTETFGKLKDNYISKGKAKLIYRHYPLNAPALQATMLVECFADNTTKQEFLGKLFTTQSKWAFNKNFTAKLGKIAQESGIKSESIFACIADTKKQDVLLGLQLKAQQGLVVQSTPTLFINGEKYSGPRSYDKMSEHIDSLLNSEDGEKHE